MQTVRVLWLLFLLPLTTYVAKSAAAPKTPKAAQGQSIVIVLKNGKQQGFAMSDVARIEFQGSAESKSPDNSAENLPGRGHFLGKWELGEGNGETFHVTLDSSGEATKSIGANSHGTWTVVNGEARITWDEGSWDAIRRVGNHYMKFWYPDGNFSGKPGNVASAEHTAGKPI